MRAVAVVGAAEPVTREVPESVMQVVVGHVDEYRRLHKEIDALEAQAKEEREAVCALLDTGTAEAGAVWEFPNVGAVRIVKGRVTTKLDRAKLARAGVAAEVLDAATVTTEGSPSVRIEGWKEEAE